MKKFVIRGQKPLEGTVTISGSKNAALPILAATLLADGCCTLRNIPQLTDIMVMCEILSELGCSVTKPDGSSVMVDPTHLSRNAVPYQLAGRLRGSFLVMGPLLAKTGNASIALPGGCPIGTRPIDLHVKGLAALGADIRNTQGSVIARADRLYGAKIYLDFPSVGATENIMCAAVLAEGESFIENAAVEPEIVDLANFLCSMGAKITGAGTDTIKIKGVNCLVPTQYTIISDRIEAGTFLAAAAATGGCVTVKNILPDYLKPLTAKLTEMDLSLTVDEEAITIKGNGDPRSVDIKTLPFPGFPTDMQAQMTALLTISQGTGIVTETIFENRFMHAPELNRMGASIKVAGRSAVIEGKSSLSGAKVKATDLRAGAALVIAGLAARGDTEISDIYHIERGYDRLDEKLRTLGAQIIRITDN
ncbi:MAG: UDP-N-acetylglucosamine 1-carboxyvinyltransferase [Ruminococcaceae bacterium]|nr:UDP-N-acetylglucosamine 1-carboxyvinyltransferase [Oscillospiraceae bacterium]